MPRTIEFAGAADPDSITGVQVARNYGRLTPFAVAIAAIAAIGPLRSTLNARYKLRENVGDVYPLPPTSQVATLSLGYRAALADLLFAHVLVSAGIHVQEKRPFEFVGNYLDAINELDPTFERPYRLADTLLTLQAKQPPPESYRKARAVLERGMKAFPFDAALWSSAGQYMAYLAPSGLTDPAERDEYRLAGGRVLAHACELVSQDEAIPYHCIAAAGLLTHAGAQEASRQFLERVLMVNDAPEIRAMALNALARIAKSTEPDRTQARYQRFQSAWAADLPFVTRGAYLTVGPNFQPAACAGLSASCATSWRAWGELNSPDSTSRD